MLRARSRWFGGGAAKVGRLDDAVNPQLDERFSLALMIMEDPPETIPDLLELILQAASAEGYAEEFWNAQATGTLALQAQGEALAALIKIGQMLERLGPITAALAGRHGGPHARLLANSSPTPGRRWCT